MKHELFVEQPSIDLMEGIRVTEETALTFKSDSAEQTLKDLVLETVLEETGSTGFNRYSTKSRIRIELNPGDILLLHKERGYYLPKFPVESVEEAVADLESLRGLGTEAEG